MTVLEPDPIDRRRLLQAAGAAGLVAIAGCLGDDGGDADESTDESEAGSVADLEPVDVAADVTWRTASVKDVTTDESFHIADFDRPTIVHTFARGCAVCHAQQDAFDEFYASAGGDVEIVDLTTDPNDDPDLVREYAAEDGFDWRFGSSTQEVTASLVETFGQDVTVSARSPVVLVCPEGDVYRLDKVVDADALASVVEEGC